MISYKDEKDIKLILETLIKKSAKFDQEEVIAKFNTLFKAEEFSYLFRNFFQQQLLEDNDYQTMLEKSKEELDYLWQQMTLDRENLPAELVDLFLESGDIFEDAIKALEKIDGYDLETVTRGMEAGDSTTHIFVSSALEQFATDQAAEKTIEYWEQFMVKK